MREKRLSVLQAQETLAQFMIHGQPEWRLFENTIEAAIREVRPPAGYVGLRAYGEMVGILWKAAQYSAAIRLEQFWNKLLASKGFNLFCGYPIDIFGEEFHIAAVDALLCAHTHLLPAGRNGDIESAIDRSMDEILGPRAEGLRLLMKANFRPSGAVMPRAEATILWLRNNLRDDADEILARSRQYYQEAQPVEPHGMRLQREQ